MSADLSVYLPPASQLALFTDLPKCAAGEKVRFRARVCTYNQADASLLLESTEHPGLHVLLDVRLCLESLHSDVLILGTWIQVIGYVTSVPSSTTQSITSPTSRVQALNVWVSNESRADVTESTQTFNSALRDRQAAMELMRRSRDAGDASEMQT